MASKVVGVGVVSTGEPPVQGVIRNLNSRQASPSFTASSRRHAANPVRQTTCRPSPFLPHFSLVIKRHARHSIAHQAIQLLVQDEKHGVREEHQALTSLF
jgi:hypothetical protein